MAVSSAESGAVMIATAAARIVSSHSVLLLCYAYLFEPCGHVETRTGFHKLERLLITAVPVEVGREVAVADDFLHWGAWSGSCAHILPSRFSAPPVRVSFGFHALVAASGIDYMAAYGVCSLSRRW